MKKEYRMMIKHVLIVVLSIIALIATGIGCYVGLVNLFGVEIKRDNSSNNKKVIATDVSLSRKVCNLIYSVNSKEGLVDGVVLEFFNSDIGKLDYVTVPANVKLNLDDDLREDLQEYGYKVEKTLSLRKLIEVFGQRDAYQFGQIILADVLGIEISYYTAFEHDVMAKYFVQSTDRFYVVGADKKLKRYEYDMYVLSESYITKTEQVENDIATLMEQAYVDLESNFSLLNKKSYIPSYKEAQIELIYNWHVIGEEQYNQFILNKEMNDKLFKFIKNTKTQYKIAQDEYNDKIELSDVSK